MKETFTQKWAFFEEQMQMNKLESSIDSLLCH